MGVEDIAQYKTYKGQLDGWYRTDREARGGEGEEEKAGEACYPVVLWARVRVYRRVRRCLGVRKWIF